MNMLQIFIIFRGRSKSLMLPKKLMIISARPPLPPQNGNRPNISRYILYIPIFFALGPFFFIFFILLSWIRSQLYL